MDEIRIFGYCACCGNQVTDKEDAHYITEDGEILCDVECVCEYYGVTKREV